MRPHDKITGVLPNRDGRDGTLRATRRHLLFLILFLSGVLLIEARIVSIVTPPAYEMKLARGPAPAKGPARTSAVVTPPDTSADSPEFLGPNRRNCVSRGVHLARDWAAQPPRLLWRHSVGAGWSSFAVVGSDAITQEKREGDDATVCYEIPTGRPRWLHSHTGHAQLSESQGGDGPRATPTISAGHVYAIDAAGILDCLDSADGALMWSRDVLADVQARNPMFGKTASPLIVDGLVLISGGDDHGPTLIAYDCHTGKRVWAAGNDHSSYSSPMLATLAGKRQILLVGATNVSGYEPADGRILWTYPWGGDTIKVSQPVPLDGNRLLLSAGYGVGCVLLQIHPEDENRLPQVLWKTPHLKTRFSNVVIFNGFVYGLDDETLACLDLATGKRCWRDGAYGYGQLLLVDDLLLVQVHDGNVALIEPNPERCQELTRFSAIRGKTWNQPVVAGRRLLVRNGEEAACYELP